MQLQKLQPLAHAGKRIHSERRQVVKQPVAVIASLVSEAKSAQSILAYALVNSTAVEQ